MGTARMSETQDLEREIHGLSEILGGERVRVEGEGDERRRPCVDDEAARPSPDETKPTQGAARSATALPTTPTIPLEVRTVEPR
jgi:hypothetical protein